jgi:Flp pilus assembly protein TadD
MKNHLVIILIVTTLISSCNWQQERKMSRGEAEAQMKEDYMKIYDQYGEKTKEEIAQLLKDYVKKYPLNFNGWNFLGGVQSDLGNYSEAEIAFKKSLIRKSNNRRALVGLGVAYRNQGQYLEAESLYIKSLEIDSNYAPAYGSLINIELIKGDSVKAMKYIQKAWQLDSNSTTLASNLTIAYHFWNDTIMRNYYYKKSEELGSEDMDILQMICNDELTFEQAFQIGQ